jgi:polyhydroxyalkanoate synthesis regulator phasin
MIENINEFLGNMAQTDLGKAARRSARTVWNAHKSAFETTRHEAGKVLGAALEQGQKFTSRGRNKAEGVVEDLAGAADERLTTIEQAVQQGVSRVIHRIGLPTAKDVNALSRRVEALAARVDARKAPKARKAPRRASRRAA